MSIDLAQVQVTNIGRSAVSIQSVALDFGRVRALSWRRCSTAGFPFAIRGGVDQFELKLEPGDVIKVFFDFWPLADASKGRSCRGHRVRAVVRTAGKRRKLSKRLSRWKVSQDAVSLFPYHKTTPDARAFRELFRRIVRNNGEECFKSAWPSVALALKNNPSQGSIQDALDQTIGSITRMLPVPENTHKAHVGLSGRVLR